ncbi:MAG: hypothetical protein ABIG93_00545 [archaeon]|nr:hypothetical protein [Nanoarchaeota archaeon]
MAELIKKDQGVTRKVSERHYVINFVTKNLSENMSLAVGVGEQHFGTARSLRSDRVYYVLEGKLIVNKKLFARVGDIIFVPKGEEYTLEGTFKAVVINTPAFDPNKEN